MDFTGVPTLAQSGLGDRGASNKARLDLYSKPSIENFKNSPKFGLSTFVSFFTTDRQTDGMTQFLAALWITNPFGV